MSKGYWRRSFSRLSLFSLIHSPALVNLLLIGTFGSPDGTSGSLRMTPPLARGGVLIVFPLCGTLGDMLMVRPFDGVYPAPCEALVRGSGFNTCTCSTAPSACLADKY